MKSYRQKSLLPRGWANKGRGRQISAAASPFTTINLWSHNRKYDSIARYHQELRRAKELGCDDMYRAMFDYRYRATLDSK